MARSKAPKNLDVDGTDKLAARSKQSDKHEKPELTVEEATVASPRPSRHRAGDFHDFEGENSIAEEPSGNSAARKSGRSKKIKKTVTTEVEVQIDEGEEPIGKAKRGRPTKDNTPKSSKEKVSKPDSGKQAEENKNESKEIVKKAKAKKSKKAGKETTESKDQDADVAPETSDTKSKTKSKKSKSASEKHAANTDTNTIEPELAMDEGPLNNLLEHEAANGLGSTAEASTKPLTGKAKKEKKKSGKEAKGPTTKTVKMDDDKPAAETVKKAKGNTQADIGAAVGTANHAKEKGKAGIAAAGDLANQTKAKVEAGSKKAKKAAKDSVPSTETAAEAADSVTKAAEAGTEKVQKTAKSAKDKLPTTETAAVVADAVTKEAKAAGEEAKKAGKVAKDKATEGAGAVTETAKATVEKVKKASRDAKDTAAESAGAVEGAGKAAAEKLKKAGKDAKDSVLPTQTPAQAAEAVGKKAKNVVQPKENAKSTKGTNEQSKPEISKSKKRKASSAEAETVKANLLDPLSEHAEASAKKKQKKDKAKSKSLGAAVGDLLSTAAEGANAAGASLGALASSIMGGAAELTGSTEDAAKKSAESAKSAASKAKGKGNAITKDVAESSGEGAVSEAPGHDFEDEDDYESDAELDDHTAALLAGFESDLDDHRPTGEGFMEGEEMPELPDVVETKKKLGSVKADTNEGPGVVYVGRIPHGFYEHEMRQYFSQFGDINRLRLSRNKKTGQSRHFAFIEFNSAGVAHIVAETMDNYLMFGHLVKCKVVPKEQLHENLWKGANKRFKKVPWNKKEGRKHEIAVGRDHWVARNEKEEKRRASKKEKTKEIGYEFEAAPLKSVDQVPKKDTSKKIEDGEAVETFEEEKSLVTANSQGAEPVVISEEIKTKKSKKTPKTESTITTTVSKKSKRALDTAEDAAGSVSKKAKKAAKGATD